MGLTVTAIIPVHNAGNTLGTALVSILTQKRSVDEIIVVDDCSTDHSVDVVAKFISKSLIPIQLLSTNSNSGPGVARNIGWNHASCDLIAFLDADDVWHPDKVALQLAFMESNPTTVMSCHDRSVGKLHSWAKTDAECLPLLQFTFREFQIKNRCATPSVMIRRSIPERFSEDLRFAEDYHLWLIISATYGSVAFIDLPLANCSSPAYGGSGLSGRMGKMYSSEIRIWRFLHRGRVISLPRAGFLIVFSTLKFLVRLFDNRVLQNRIQTVSESK